MKSIRKAGVECCGIEVGKLRRDNDRSEQTENEVHLTSVFIILVTLPGGKPRGYEIEGGGDGRWDEGRRTQYSIFPSEPSEMSCN